MALVVLIGLIAIQAIGSGPGGDSGGPTANGPITADQLPNPPKRPKPIGNPDRIKEVLQPGKTYHVLLQAGIEARVEDKRYTVKTATNMVYAAEFIIRRKIERNDGKEVVEVRTFDSCRTVKAESHVEELKLDWGLSGDLLLVSLEFVEPGLGVVAIESKAVIEKLMHGTAQNIAASNVESWQKTDSLSGKSVRITYRDGEGVVSIEPLDGGLSADETAILFNTAILSDHYLFPDANVKPGDQWEVDAYQLSALVDPSLRGVPSGNTWSFAAAARTSSGRTGSWPNWRSNAAMLSWTARTPRRAESGRSCHAARSCSTRQTRTCRRPI